MIPTQRKEAMQISKSNRMKHQSFVLPDIEREAFRYLCSLWKMTPSEALRGMVRILLCGGYDQETIRKESQR